MPGIATGETFSLAEGRLYLYASASGTASGSGIGFFQGGTLAFRYGWFEYETLNGKRRRLTGRAFDALRERA